MPPPPKIIKAKAFRNVKITSEVDQEYSIDALEQRIFKSGVDHRHYDSQLMTDRNRFNIINMLRKNEACNDWQEKVNMLYNQQQSPAVDQSINRNESMASIAPSTKNNNRGS